MGRVAEISRFNAQMMETTTLAADPITIGRESALPEGNGRHE